ncbi:MAG: preprotein translocase subunit YajC [Alphaproteobacteria bacterium]|nr:preprotein translocase subunit YajC [Alphaproteobacteria bacterium]
MFISDAFAQGSAGGGSALTSFLPIILIFAIFYFLIIAPQRKKQKAHEAKLNALVRGTQIVTGGGLYGTVQRVTDQRVEVTLDGDGATVVVNRATIAGVITADANVATSNDKPSKANKGKDKADKASKAKSAKASSKVPTKKVTAKKSPAKKASK